MTSLESWVGRSLSGGRYRIEAKLGENGLGLVYRAHDRNLDCHVVIKVPRGALREHPQFAAIFAHEIGSLFALVHPNLVRIIDRGEEDGVPFAVMHYLPGGNLRKQQRAGLAGKPDPIEPRALKGWLESIATALDFIHNKGYVHRDVKPDNILFDHNGHAYLSDFGIANLVAECRKQLPSADIGAGLALGTAPYMAPEMILGRPHDGRADQYSLAVSLYELLSGSLPFSAATPAALAVQQTQPLRRLDAVVPSLPKGMAAVVHRALEANPDKRFADCRTLAREALVLAVKSASRTATPAPAAQPSSPATGAAATNRVQCPKCGKKLTIPGSAAGKRIRCPACRESFAVPGEKKSLEESKKAPQPTRETIPVAAEKEEVAEAFLDARVKVQSEPKEARPKRRESTVYQYDDPNPKTNRTAWVVGISVGVLALGLGAWGTYALLGKNQDEAPPGPPTIAGPGFAPQPTASNQPSPAAIAQALPKPPAGNTGKPGDTRRLLASNLNANAPAASLDPKRHGAVATPALPSAVQLLGRHSDRVYAVGFSPDGAIAFSASGMEACVWDCSSAKNIRRFPLDAPGLVAAVFSATGHRLLAATGQADAAGSEFTARDLRVWDTDTGSKLKTIPAGNGEIVSIAISADGRRCLAGMKKGAAMWDLDAGRVLQRFPSGSRIENVCFLPGGNQVLTASAANVTLWDSATGAHLHPYSVASTHLLCVTPDGQRFLAGGDTIVAWEPKTKRRVSTFPAPQPLAAIAISPDGRFGAAAEPESVRVWTVDTGEEFKGDRLKLPGRAAAIAFASGGKSLIAGCRDGSLLLWTIPDAHAVAQARPAVTAPEAGKWIPLIEKETQLEEHWRAKNKLGKYTFDPVLKTVLVSASGKLGTLSRDGPWKKLSFRVTIRRLPSKSLTLRFGETRLRIPNLDKNSGTIAVEVQYSPIAASFTLLVDGRIVQQSSGVPSAMPGFPAPTATAAPRKRLDRLSCALDSNSTRPAELLFSEIQVFIDE
jgi:serine/threonine protein kinase/WD40 repeat protein